MRNQSRAHPRYTDSIKCTCVTAILDGNNFAPIYQRRYKTSQWKWLGQVSVNSTLWRILFLDQDMARKELLDEPMKCAVLKMNLYLFESQRISLEQVMLYL